METQNIGQTEWAILSPEGKKEQLILEQLKMLDTFREKNAISQAQYEEGVRYLKESMDLHITD